MVKIVEFTNIHMTEKVRDNFESVRDCKPTNLFEINTLFLFQILFLISESSEEHTWKQDTCGLPMIQDVISAYQRYQDIDSTFCLNSYVVKKQGQSRQETKLITCRQSE